MEKIYQTTIDYTKWQLIIPNGHKIYKLFFILRPSKIYPNWDFWFENKPSGNPAQISFGATDLFLTSFLPAELKSSVSATDDSLSIAETDASSATVAASPDDGSVLGPSCAAVAPENSRVVGFLDLIVDTDRLWKRKSNSITNIGRVDPLGRYCVRTFRLPWGQY
jgi:hypothetical protein